MSNEFQMQEEAKPGEREERERLRREREEREKRITETASQYATRSLADKIKDLQNADLAELAENAKQYARQKPGQAMLISAGVGLLLGLIIRGRR